MTHLLRTHKHNLAALLAILAASAGAAHSVHASGPRCRRVHARVFLQAEETPTCGSAIGLCASGELMGNLSGRSSFIGTSAMPLTDTPPDMPETAVVLLTGDNRIETSRGTLMTKDAIVLRSSGNGEFAEVDRIVGGTGQYAGATGTLTATGTFVSGSGEGLLEGEICVP